MNTPASALRFDELFSPDFLTDLQRLSLRARRVPRGGRHGSRLSKQLGTGVEFKDYRPYSPGDDLRAIDWNIYRRLGKLSLRLFEEQQDLPIYVMPDLSGSMLMEPQRIVAGLRASLAIAAIGLEHHDSAGLFPFSDELKVLFKAKSGRASVMTFARHLAALLDDAREGAPTRLVHSLHKLSHMKLRPGLLVIVSDFLDEAGVEGLQQAMRGIRHRLLLIQLTRRGDADPRLQGDVRLRDCETGETVDLTMTPEVIQRYQAAYAAFNDALEDLARRRSGRRLRVDADRDLVEQFGALFNAGALEV